MHRHQGTQLVARVRRGTAQRAAFLQFVTCQASAGEGDFAQNAGIIAQHFLGNPRLGHALSFSPATVLSFPNAHGAVPVPGISTA